MNIAKATHITVMAGFDACGLIDISTFQADFCYAFAQLAALQNCGGIGVIDTQR